MTFRDLLRDTIATLLAHKRRTLLTMFGIAWGIISITLMVAAGEGLGRGIQKQQENFGKDVMIVFAGRTSMQAGGTRSGRAIHWMEGDYKEVAQEAPACKYVLPEKTIITSLPKFSCCFWMPRPRPSPAAIISVMEMMPHAMPNMVSKVRRLWASSVAIVSLSRSRNVIGASLLQDHLLLFVQAGGNFRLYAIRDAKFHRHFLAPVFRSRFRQFD